VTHKNRKIRRLRELYPEVTVRILYRKDYANLLIKAGMLAPAGDLLEGDRAVG
jgi:hypoxanthine phosphoribosyltransferase